MLIEVHGPQIVGTFNRSPVSFHLAGKDAKKRGFPAAVRPYEAQPHTGRKIEIQILEQRTPAELLTQSLNMD
jgi:hypothetical protein